MVIFNDDVSIAGLNGCYSYKIFIGQKQKIRSKVKVLPETPPVIEAYLQRVLGKDPRGRFKYRDTEALKKIKADILILHEVPMGVIEKTELPIENVVGCSPINEIIESMQPKYVFCGHFHMKKESMIGNSKIVVLPKIENGYCILDTETMKIEWK